MKIRRIVPNINSSKVEESKKFYSGLLGMTLVMDMGWILTFSSNSNSTAQITIIKNEEPPLEPQITLSIEVDDIENLYHKVLASKYAVTYPMTDEPWGVRRFFVKDPNGVTINIMTHLSST